MLLLLSLVFNLFISLNSKSKRQRWTRIFSFRLIYYTFKSRTNWFKRRFSVKLAHPYWTNAASYTADPSKQYLGLQEDGQTNDVLTRRY